MAIEEGFEGFVHIPPGCLLEMVDVLQAHGAQQVRNQLEHRQPGAQRDTTPAQIGTDGEEVRGVQPIVAIDSDREPLLDLAHLLLETEFMSEIEQEAIGCGHELRSRVETEALPLGRDHPSANAVLGLQDKHILASLLELMRGCKARDSRPHDEACIASHRDTLHSSAGRSPPTVAFGG